MSIVTYPLNDIMYSAEDAEIYNSSRTSGVYALEDNLNYSITGAREITISPGIAWIKNDEFSGKAIAVKDPIVLQFDEPHSVLDRIDRAVLRFSLAENNSSVVANKGVEASSPIPTERSTAADLYELVLYDVSIPHGLVELTDANITDQRANPELCGLMTDGVSSLKNYLRFDAPQELSQEQKAQARANVEAAATTQLVGENMLLNWDFRNPVNQRGVASWSNGYGIDMWRAGGNGNSWTSNGLSLSDSWLTQFFEKFVTNGKQHTVTLFSAQLGNVYDSATLIPTASGDVHAYLFDGKVQVGLENNANGFKAFVMRATGAGVGVNMVKLELGTVSTLEMSAPMNYGAELQKCRRYFFAVTPQSWGGYGYAISSSTNNASVYVMSGVQMRLAVPTIAAAENLYLGGTAITGTPVSGRSLSGAIRMGVSQSGITTGSVFEFMGREAVPKLWISAEL